MKKSTLLAVFVTAFFLFGIHQVGWGQALLDENFSYTVGTDLTANGWNITATTASPTLAVSASSISFTSYLSSGIGNEVTLATSGQDVNRTFTSQTSGIVYASCLINVTSATTTGDYFFHLGAAVISTAYQGRVYIKRDASNNLAFGISRAGAVATAIFTPFSYSLNTTYLLVLKFTIVPGTTNDISEIYINPALNSIEPTTGWTASTDTPADLANIGSVALRQGGSSTAAAMKLDGIRIATAWADIVGLTSSPTVTAAPPTLTGFSYAVGSGPSTEQSFVVSGTNLTNDIVVTPSANYEISLSSGALFVAGSSITLLQNSGSVPSTTFYTRLKAGLTNASYNSESITVNSTGATTASVVCSGSVLPQIDWANLQWPGSGSITVGGAYNVYAQVYEPGVTDGAGQGTGITCWIGYSTSNTNPNTWTNWVPTTYNSDNGNNDEYTANIGAVISTAGTYYYASRFQLGTSPYVYGGFSGGFWTVGTNVSGQLTVTAAPQIEWANLQWPGSGTIAASATYNVYAQVYKAGVTDAVGLGAGITTWIGYNTTNTNPNTWTNWVAATYSSDQGNNDEYLANLGSAIATPGTYYYASRFKLNAADYVYGGFSGGFWDGTSNISGVLSVYPGWTAGWPKAETPSGNGFTAKVNLDAIGTSYFVVVPSGATAPTSAQVKAGQNAAGTALAANLKGTIACAAASTEYTSSVAGLASATTYDIYFVAEDGTPVLQVSPVLKSVTTLAAATAPLVSSPTASSITNNAAVLGGNITSDGGGALTERGTVWNTSTGVTIADNKLAASGTATGVFSHTRASLPAQTNIFYKAYATNSAGTTLSTEASFFTLATEPSTHVIGFTATPAGFSSIDLSWTTAATGAYGYLILKKAGASAPTGTPSDATAYAVGNTVGDATVAAIVAPGSTLTKTISGLLPTTQYYFTIIPFGYDGSNAATYNYNITAVIPSAQASTTAPPAGTYIWNVASGTWNTPASWTPARTTPNASDVLIFDGAVQPSAVVTLDFTTPENIGRLQLINNAAVSFATSNAIRTLNIGALGATAPQFDLQSGSSLTVSATFALTVLVPAGNTASISGNIIFQGAAHKLNGADAASITFNSGSSLYQGNLCTGNIFTNAGTASVVNFTSGSVFTMKGAGSNPFALTSPLSKVIFQSGSLYKHKSSNSPSFSGRSYANFELDTLGIVFTATGGSAAIVENMTITAGTLNYNMTGTPGHLIKGNISVAAGQTLTFSPLTAGTINLGGTASQTISGAGTLSFGAFSTFVVNNSSGVVLNRAVAFNNLTLTSGIITTGVNTATVNGIITGGSATSHIDGKLARPYTIAASKDFPIGKSGIYRPVTLAYTALDAASTVTAEQTESAMSGTLPASTSRYANRYWTLTQTGATVFAYDITLDGTGFTPLGTPVMLKNDLGTITSLATTGTPPAYTATGLTNFSDFTLGDYTPPAITATPATLTGFGYTQGSGPSAEQTFSVSGVFLTNNISIAAPTNYEISTTTGAGFTTPITLTPSSGTVAATTIYVRLKAGLTAAAYNGEVINITCTGATAKTVTCSGSVINPVLSVGTLSSFGSVCINTTAGPSTFTISGTELTTASVSLGALTGYTYSTTSGGTYTTTLTLPQTGGTFSATVYVKFSPTLVQSYNGNIVVSGGGATSVNCAATGSGINTAPAVTTTSPATLVTGITASCSGNVTDGGCTAVTARGICYGLTVNPDITGTKTTETGTTGVFTSNLTGLTPATTYHYRAYVTSSVATTYGSDFTFTTLAVLPTVVTNAATGVTSVAASLNGTVNANNSSTVVTFEYGTTVAYGNVGTAVPSPVTGTSNTAVAFGLTGLTPNTTYHFRVIGVNIAGTSNGNDLTFTTTAVLPTVVTNAATLVTASSATLNGSVNANNASTAVTFEYGTTVAYGTVVTAIPSPVTGISNTAVTYALSGLAPNTTYHFRAVGVNTAGTANGNDLTFTTSALAPTVVTTAATLIGAISATLNGTVNANNQNATVTFEYGLTTAYGTIVNAVPNTVTGFTATPVSASLTGLPLYTTYHYRVVAVNATGTSNGNDLTFSTNCTLPSAAGAISGPASACQTSAGITYTVGAITQATSYVWAVPAGATLVSGNGTNTIVVDFGATAASGNISVYGTSTCGNGVASTLAVTVNARPVPVISGSSTACITATNNVYSTQAGNTGYTWTVSAGGAITAGAGTNAITVTWSTLGAKTITLNYTSAGGCASLTAGTFNVTVNPVPSPTLSGPTQLCAGSTGVVYTTEAGFNNYVWTISYGGTITSGLNSNIVTVNWATAGNRTISVNYENALGCSATQPVNRAVTILSVPVPLVTGENQVCEGATGIAYSTEPDNTNYTWTVSAGGSITSGAGTQAITVNWTGNGNQTVSVDYTNALGCGAVAPTVYNVLVNPKPAAAAAVNGTTPVCAGAAGVVYSVATIANASSYVWTIPAGATIASGSGTQSITVNFANTAASGVIKVNGTNTCGNGASSPNFNLVVNPLPATPVITQHGDTLTSSANSGNQWYLDGVAIAGATGKTHVAVYTGNYTVIVTLTGCSSAVSNSILVLPVGINTVKISKVMDIYPNPSNGQFTIKVETSKAENYTIEIFNNLGAQVWKQEDVAINGTYTAHIDLKGSPAGVYMVALRSKANSIVKKVIIMN